VVVLLLMEEWEHLEFVLLQKNRLESLAMTQYPVNDNIPQAYYYVKHGINFVNLRLVPAKIFLLNCPAKYSQHV